jgi:myo-inositol-1(or 4)-monophosphatase
MPSLLDTATDAARAAGALLLSEFRSARRVDAAEAHDIKLALDREAQDLIAKTILARFPDHAILGEEGDTGTAGAEWEWVVDPLDGTVNYFYGIPHFCVSIAARRAGRTEVGVVFDPARDELWQATADGPALLNGAPCRASERRDLSEAVVSIGFAKSSETIDAGLPLLSRLVHRVRKCRMLGSAALDLAYVACGRLDAYVESSISIWDVAAGNLLVERAGGRVEMRDGGKPGKFAIRAWNGLVDLGIAR